MSSSDRVRRGLGALFALAALLSSPELRAQGSEVGVRDWLYLRLGVGAGASSLDADLQTLDLTATGFAVPFEVSAGVKATPALAVGIGLFAASMPSLSAELSNTEVGGTSSELLLTVGPFVDYVLPGAGGVHAQVGVGYASSPFHADTDSGLEADVTGTGFSLMGGVGWEGRVAEAWGLGVLFRFQYASLSADRAELNGFDTDVDWEGSVIVPGLLVTTTFH